MFVYAQKPAKSAVQPARGIQQRESDICRKKKPILHCSIFGPAPEMAPPTVNGVQRLPGQPLDPATRTFIEPRFAYDFRRIPLHSKSRASIQAKFAVNTPGDIYEQEADRIANQVLVAPAHHPVSGAPPYIQRFSVQPARQSDSVPASVDQVLASPGRPLEPTLRKDMEQLFGHDFSRVRVHSGDAAEQSARDVNAHAYTVGRDIVFGAGQFIPRTHEGQRLIAHELTHVVQQGRADGMHTYQDYRPQTGNVLLTRGLVQVTQRTYVSSKKIQRSPDPSEKTSMFIDPYSDMPLKELKKLAKNNPEAAESLRLRYRDMPDRELSRLAAKGDAMAQSVLNQRIPENKLVKNLGKKGFGGFSNYGMYDELVDIIETERAESGIRRTGPSVVDPKAKVEGGVVGAAKTNVPGLENERFVGKSPLAGGKVNPHSKYSPPTDIKVLPHTHGHAEQHLADQLSAAFGKVPPEDLQGARVWIMIEQLPCPPCAQGIADPPGGIRSTEEVKQRLSTSELRDKTLR